MKTTLFLVKFFGKANHADDFVRGQIFANRLSEFKQAEDSDESGRMDRHEGTIAWLQPGIGRLTLNGMDMSDDLAGPIQIQKNWLNHLNVFCAHAAHSGDFDLANLSNDNVEALRQELMIPNECLSLGKYAVVVMNVLEFITRMRDSAQAKGYRIRWGLVKYYDPATFHGNFHDEEAAFWKQNHYSFQREYRFTMNSGSLGEEPLGACPCIARSRPESHRLICCDSHGVEFETFHSAKTHQPRLRGGRIPAPRFNSPPFRGSIRSAST